MKLEAKAVWRPAVLVPTMFSAGMSTSPQRLLRHDVHIGEDVVQHREIRRLPPGHIGPVGALARTLGASVIFYHKQNSFCFFQQAKRDTFL